MDIPGLVLEHARALRHGQDLIRPELGEIRHLLAAIDQRLDRLHQDAVHLRSLVAGLASGMERLQDRVARIEDRSAAASCGSEA